MNKWVTLRAKLVKALRRVRATEVRVSRSKANTETYNAQATVVKQRQEHSTQTKEMVHSSTL